MGINKTITDIVVAEMTPIINHVIKAGSSSGFNKGFDVVIP